MSYRLKLVLFLFFLISTFSIGGYTQKKPNTIKNISDELTLFESRINDKIEKLKDEVAKLSTLTNKNLKNMNDKNGSLRIIDYILGLFVLIFAAANVSFIFITSESRKKAKDELDWMKKENQKMEETKREIYEEKEKAFKSVKSELKNELEEYLRERVNVVEGRFDDFRNSFFASTGLPKDNLFLGEQALANSDYEMAETYFKQETLKHQENVKAWEGRARACLLTGKFEESLEFIDTAISLNKKNPRYNRTPMLEVKADILMHLKEYEEAKNLSLEISRSDQSSQKARRILEECVIRLEGKDNQKPGKKQKKLKHSKKSPKGDENE